MGYLTTYKLEIEKDGEQYVYLPDAIKELLEIVEFDPFDESCKWYDHAEDMIELSIRHKGTVFVLFGEGEDAGNLWRKYFKDGKTQESPAIISYIPYNENLLR